MKFTNAFFVALFVSGASAFDPNAPRRRTPGLSPRRTEFRESRGNPDLGRSVTPGSFSNAPVSGIRPVERGGPIASPQDIDAVEAAWDGRRTETVQGDSLRTW